MSDKNCKNTSALVTVIRGKLWVFFPHTEYKHSQTTTKHRYTV